MENIKKLFVKFNTKLATVMSKSGIFLALNSLASDKMAQLRKNTSIVENLNMGDESDDDSDRNDDETEECGEFFIDD